MRPYSVFQATVEGVTVPGRSLRPLRPLNEVWNAWCTSEGIDPGQVSQIDVTRFDDGTLVAYCTRYEEMPPIERELRLQTHGSTSGVAVYPGELDGPRKSMIRSYITHHPVSSIQPLLDAAFPRQVGAGALV